MHKLENTDRSLLWVELPLEHHRRAWAIYQEMRSLLANVDPTLFELEPTVRSILRFHYQAIARLTNPSFDPDDLTPRSAWEFFVGTVDGGLSGLEKLLGLSIDVPTTTTPPACTTGDPALDVTVDLLLVFKEQAIDLMSRYSLADLDKMLRQANDRQDPELQKRHQQKLDRAKFDSDEAKAALRRHYESRGIPVPDDF